MYHNEALTLPSELAGVAYHLFDLIPKLAEQLGEVPAELGLLLRSQVAMVNQEASQAITALLEETAGRTLLHRFGSPESALAVPVWKLLSDRLNQAKETTVETVGGIQQAIVDIRGLLISIAALKEQELAKLEAEEKAEQAALNQLITVDLSDERVLNDRSETARGTFKDRIEAIQAHRRTIESDQSWWEQLVGKMYTLATPLQQLEHSTLVQA